VDYLPVFLNLKGRAVLLVGGGAVAQRKAELLLLAGAELHVVAPSIRPDLAAKAASVRLRGFEPGDLDGVALVIAATSDRAVNQLISTEAAKRHLPVNVVDDPALCSFIMPAIIDRGIVTVAISTGGASPVLARLLRARIEMLLPPGIGRIAQRALAWRDRVRQVLPDAGARRHFWEWAFEQGDAEDLETLLEDAPKLTGNIDVIEVTANDPEAITLGEIRRIAAADLVLHERSVPRRILDFARRDAEIEEVDDPAASAGLHGGRVVGLILRRHPSG
jgi:uroporphyrin-III C-methyltransferase/precorrin-2 dehydrogenase/sirohydrochlorin ferrochelatase